MASIRTPAFYKKHTLPPPHVRVWHDYPLYPYHMVRAYVRRMTRVFSWRFLLFLCASQMWLKGTAYYMSMSMMLPLFKLGYGVDAFHLQLYMMITMLPWSVKPILGLLSDFFLVCGYHKRFWLLNGLVAGALSCACLFLAYATHSPVWTVFCLLGIHYQVAIFDLMSEGAYSAQMRVHPYTGSDVVTLTQGFQHVGGLVAMCFVGPMADKKLFYVLIGICSGVCLIPLVPSVLGWLPEERFPHGTPQGNPDCLARVGVHRVEEAHENRWMALVIAFTGLAAPTAALVATLGDAGYGLVLALLLTSASLLGAYHVFPALIFRVALYQVLLLLGSPSLRGALDYFYTADEQCVPGGPHFSFVYYQTYAGIVGTVCSIAGIVVYQLLLSGFRFRRVFILTGILDGLIGFSDLFIVTRTNIKLGISDHAAYIVGEAVMEPLLLTLNYIPAMALLSRACTSGMESSIFAFLAGINNFASMISSLGGAFIFHEAGVRTSEPCNFDALPLLVLACHCLAPLVVSAVGALLLIPDTHQNEALNPDGSVAVPSETLEDVDELSMENPFSEEEGGEDLLGSADSEMELI